LKIDRLHGSRQMRTIQDVEIPEVTLPVGPGRNLAVLLEAAVRNHILISKGYVASEAFVERQKQRLKQAKPA
jgi:HPr kinase/phosphorylase